MASPPLAAATMKAAVAVRPGGVDVLEIQERPIPIPEAGQVLIRVRASGLNRLDLAVRQGLRPKATFPRVLGIEAVGTVAAAPGGELHPGDIVATALGGMGMEYDGGCAEYTVVPAEQAQSVRTDLGWEILGAIPEMLQTAWGSLFKSLRLESGERLLIRGGTTAVGLAAAAIAKLHGAIVAATTRRPEQEMLLRASGVDQVFIDKGVIAEQVREVLPGGADKVLELVGSTLADSLRCAKPRGIVCMSGTVADEHSLTEFRPMEAIPTTVCLTSYHGSVEDFMQTPLDKLIQKIASGQLPIQVGRIFSLEQIREAHRCMEDNKAGGKIVILT